MTKKTGINPFDSHIRLCLLHPTIIIIRAKIEKFDKVPLRFGVAFNPYLSAANGDMEKERRWVGNDVSL